MNLSKPMASSIWLSHILHISNNSINQKIQKTITILKEQHIMSTSDLKKYFLRTSYFYKGEHTCYLLSKTGCNYLVATLHLSTSAGFNLIKHLHIHFEHPENQLRTKYQKASQKLHKNTLAIAFAKLQTKQLKQHMSVAKSFYLLKHLNYINNQGMPTALMQQSGLFKNLMALIIKYHKVRHLQIIKCDAHKSELKNINYLQILRQQIFSYAYNLKLNLNNYKYHELYNYLINLGNYIHQYNSLNTLLKSCSKRSIKLLLLASFNLKKVGQKEIVSYQEHVLSKNFNLICKYYLHLTSSVDKGLDSINTIIHGGIIND